MPVVTINISPQPTDKKAEISKVLTENLSRITGIQEKSFIILFNEFPPESIASGGKLLSELYKP